MTSVAVAKRAPSLPIAARAIFHRFSEAVGFAIPVSLALLLLSLHMLGTFKAEKRAKTVKWFGDM